ncbi:MAG: hypothetical protein ACFFAN_14640 [Promethearchaeota archaeon]
MSYSVYKVIFKENKETNKNKLTLTFRSIKIDYPIKIPIHYILQLKKLSETNQTIITFRNIDEVIKFGKDISEKLIKNYIILLFQSKQKKEGFLIGNVKDLGIILIGIWPFNEKQILITAEKFYEKLNDLIKNSQDYSKICLIN